MFWLRNKTIVFQLHTLIWRPGLPESISGWGWNVDCKCSIQFLQLDREYQPRIGDFRHSFLDVLVLCGSLEILGRCYLVNILHPGLPLPTM